MITQNNVKVFVHLLKKVALWRREASSAFSFASLWSKEKVAKESALARESLTIFKNRYDKTQSHPISVSRQEPRRGAQAKKEMNDIKNLVVAVLGAVKNV